MILQSNYSKDFNQGRIIVINDINKTLDAITDIIAIYKDNCIKVGHLEAYYLTTYYKYV